jgi:hypothetical protein
MTITERATVAVFGVLLALVFLAMSVAISTHDRGKTDASTEKIEMLRVRPAPITIPWAHFMLAGRDEHLSQPL